MNVYARASIVVRRSQVMSMSVDIINRCPETFEESQVASEKPGFRENGLFLLMLTGVFSVTHKTASPVIDDGTMVLFQKMLRALRESPLKHNLILLVLALIREGDSIAGQ